MRRCNLLGDSHAPGDTIPNNFRGMIRGYRVEPGSFACHLSGEFPASYLAGIDGRTKDTVSTAEFTGILHFSGFTGNTKIPALPLRIYSDLMQTGVWDGHQVL